jgi:DNA (cytosine-5)-methyltransferase 1
MNRNLTFGSVCSGIEASQFAFKPFAFEQLWSSEIADFPSKVLKYHYPKIRNIGNMLDLPELILEEKIKAPDLLCGGTPCQAFSLAGLQNGLSDERGQLTMSFIEIANAIDTIRNKQNKGKSIILWENVEGVLNEKTNAFGNFLSGLAGFDEVLKVKKWTKAGFLLGKTRNIAWRVLDAKYFGLPQQRKRLFVLAGGKSFRPDKILFEFDKKNILTHIKNQKNTQTTSLGLFSNLKKRITEENKLVFLKGEDKFQIFRDYTDCLYSAYATKWNGNAAAYNGSLYIAQNDKIRRLVPLECERLMGFPDNYTLINGNSDTNRYHAVGNSWAVPVVKWIGEKINNYITDGIDRKKEIWNKVIKITSNNINAQLYLLGGVNRISPTEFLNTSFTSNNPTFGDLRTIVQSENIPKKFYLTPKACRGILRRKEERKIKMNTELERLMQIIADEIEKKTIENK